MRENLAADSARYYAGGDIAARCPYLKTPLHRAMLVVDQLKKNDRDLQVLALGVLIGMLILFCGLWWVQIVSAPRHEANLKDQSFRSVRVPAVRGKILDANGAILAENSPSYGINVYLEELVKLNWFHYTNSVRPQFTNETGLTKVTGTNLARLNMEARYRSVSNLTFRISAAFKEPRVLDRRKFSTHYVQYPYMPFPLFQHLTAQQVAIFSEQFSGLPGLELEMRPLRYYPKTNTAAHLLGYVQRDDQPDEDEENTFKYYLPDFAGKIGMEGIFDEQLRGKAGVKSLLVNNVGFRQREEMLTQTRPGKDLMLTIDLSIQQAAEKALSESMARVRGAVVVMDVRNGDVLALVSLPAFDPNQFPSGVSQTEWLRLNDEKYSHMFNRATFGEYPPGSILKILTGLACLEAGVLNPSEKMYNPGYYHDPKVLGRRRIDDTAPEGEYDFERAFKLSSNTYFIHYGLKAGMNKLIEVARRFHLGERTDVFPRQEQDGHFPKSLQGKSAGDVANICIGQGDVTVTPIQMACMTAAIANGGRLYWPRLVKETRGVGEDGKLEVTAFPAGRLRDDVHIHPRHLKIIHHAMLSDVEDRTEGTGRAAYMPNFQIGGKTGTAEIKGGGRLDKITWFTSFGPMENPRYAVVVMVESGGSGGGTCAPVARKVYEAIQKRDGSGTRLASTTN